MLRSVDLGTLGNRIRAFRQAAGLTQSDLAEGSISVGYVSRIESGQRRPTAEVLESMAVRLKTSSEALLSGVEQHESDEIRVLVDFAELALESGEAVDARTQARSARQRARAVGLREQAERAAFVLARSHEALGQYDDAIIALEDLVAGAESPLLRLRAGISLSRCHRETGDLARAIECAEGLLAQLEPLGLDGCDESVQLAVTLAAAFHERGDTSHAVRVCRRAVEKAERMGSPKARASAYWNAAMMYAERGDYGDAVPLASEALRLLSDGQDARNLTRLRTELGRMQLELDPPEVEGASEILDAAADELAWVSASPADVSRNALGRGLAALLSGDTELAEQLSEEIVEAESQRSPLVAADACCLRGRAQIERGDVDSARASFRQAVLLLSAAGSDRAAAQVWFGLASLLEQVGMYDEARTAYRSAAASTGLRHTFSRRVRVNLVKG